MASKRKRTYIVGIAVAFLLPLFSFLIFTQVSKGKIKIPKHYGINFIDTFKSADGILKYDTIYKEVGDLALVNQLGQKVTLNRDLRGKILIISLFDTDDTSISKVVANNLHNLELRFQQKASEKPQQDNVGNLFQIVSISIKPQQHPINQIRIFADDHHANSDRWWILTGDSAAIYQFASNQLSLPLLHDGHLNKDALKQLVLVDTLRHIRGYFNGLEPYQLSQLADNISIVSMEKNK